MLNFKYFYLSILFIVLMTVNSFAMDKIPAPANESEETCILTICVQLGKTKEVDALLQGGIKGIGSGKNGNMPMYYSIMFDSPDCLYLLLKHGVDPNYIWTGEFGGFPLAIAAQHGRVRCSALLLDCGAKAEQADERGFSSMYWAVIAQNVEIINLLLVNGGHLNAADISALTPESRRWIGEKKLLVIMEKGVPKKDTDHSASGSVPGPSK